MKQIICSDCKRRDVVYPSYGLCRTCYSKINMRKRRNAQNKRGLVGIFVYAKAPTMLEGGTVPQSTSGDGSS